jgi:Spx/MgsR family transcriptional regulator
VTPLAITLYGIPNCDTIRQARKWLQQQDIAYQFHDFKKQGIEEDRLRGWVKELGWEALLNRRGMMWRKVPDAVRAGIDEEGAIKLMLETPAIIKRPVLDLGDRRMVGFDESAYDKALK